MPRGQEQDPRRTRKISPRETEDLYQRARVPSKKSKIDHGRRNVLFVLGATGAGVGILMLNPFGIGTYFTEKGVGLVSPNRNSKPGSSEQSVSQNVTLETVADGIAVPIENKHDNRKIVAVKYHVPKEKMLVIAVRKKIGEEGHTTQVAGIFHNDADLNTYITDKREKGKELYEQEFHPVESRSQILFLGQKKENSVIVVLFKGPQNGSDPQINHNLIDSTAEGIRNEIDTLRKDHSELLNLVPDQNFNYDWTKPTDEHFA